ncbi:MAG: phosphoribosylglycinamide formyltransferase [Treponema sp.]|nr:phosphoribosylglycinamide formyltransferase [Treponema sp.]
MNILVLVSGNGTNLQALIDAERGGRFRGKEDYPGGHIAAVVSDRPAHALRRAEAAGIPAYTEEPRRSLRPLERRRELSDRILGIARRMDAKLIILAGFLSILEGDIVEAYKGKIINIHPSLLPKFGGKGMYGEKVHRAVLEAGERESGCTVHIVDAGTDTGPVILQRKVPVLDGDSPEALAGRIHAEEYAAITDAAVMMLRRLYGGITAGSNDRGKQ